MSADIESRKFRAWDQSSQTTSNRQWLLIGRYNALRIARSPMAWLLGVVALVSLAPTYFTLELFNPDQVKAWRVYDFSNVGAIITTISVVSIVLLGSANFSDDVRFNSLLFYFSRPLRSPDYLWGKLLGLATVIAAFGAMLVLILVLVLIDGQVAIDENSYYEAYIRTTGQAYWLAFAAILGFVAFNIYALGTISLLSLYAKRGWHALLGWVVLNLSWSFAVMVVAPPFKATAGALLFSPLGWVSAHSLHPYDRLTDHATLGIIPVFQVLSALIATVIGISCLFLCLHRLKKMEGTV